MRSISGNRTSYTWLLVILVGLGSACQSRTAGSENTTQSMSELVATDTDSPVDAQVVERPERKSASSRLTSGLYRGGLKLAVDDNTVSGYFQDATGWNEQVNAPQFSCEYTFVGQYKGSDTIQLILPNNDGVTGQLQILSTAKFRVTLSRNPCNNEQPSAQTWEIERAYPLLGMKDVTAAKSYFHSAPAEGKRKAYLVRGDKAEITGVRGEWFHVRYEGATSTTEGWMQASAFGRTPTSGKLAGRWIARAGQSYEVYFEFYPNNRYKTWTINSLEPLGMTGNFTTDDTGIIALAPCGGTEKTMPFRYDASGALNLMMPGTDRWTIFEKSSGDSQPEEPGFSIGKGEVITSVNNRVIHIPAEATKAKFLEVVCPFEVTPDELSTGEATFDILRVSIPGKGVLFDAFLDGDEVTAIVIESPVINKNGIGVGSTFGELKRAIPSVVMNRSEIEGKVVGSTEHCTFSFGYLSSQLFNANTGSIPDSTRIRQIFL